MARDTIAERLAIALGIGLAAAFGVLALGVVIAEAWERGWLLLGVIAGIGAAAVAIFLDVLIKVPDEE